VAGREHSHGRAARGARRVAKVVIELFGDACTDVVKPASAVPAPSIASAQSDTEMRPLGDCQLSRDADSLAAPTDRLHSADPSKRLAALCPLHAPVEPHARR
jgi:hypothetical protein